MGKAREQRRRMERENAAMGHAPGSPAYENQNTYYLYQQWLYTLAMRRYEWELPDSCDGRWLEWSFLTKGLACFYADEGGLRNALCTVTRLDRYNNPLTWSATYPNQLDAAPKLDVTDSVAGYATSLRKTPSIALDQFSRRLAKLERVRDVNLLQQRFMKIVGVPEERYQDALDLMKQADAGEPFLIANNSLLVDTRLESLDVGSAYIGNDLWLTKQKLWNEALTYLGYQSANVEKRERLVSAEVGANQQSLSAVLLDGLRCREDICGRVGKVLGYGISVRLSEAVQEKEEEVQDDAQQQEL